MKMKFTLALLLISNIVFASGTYEQYRNIWIVILSPIWIPLFLWFIYHISKYFNKSIDKNHKSIINTIEKKQKLNTNKIENEGLKNKEFLNKSIDILQAKGYTIQALKYGWRVIAPNGHVRDFYDIEFLYNYALVQ